MEVSTGLRHWQKKSLPGAPGGFPSFPFHAGSRLNLLALRELEGSLGGDGPCRQFMDRFCALMLLILVPSPVRLQLVPLQRTIGAAAPTLNAPLGTEAHAGLQETQETEPNPSWMIEQLKLGGGSGTGLPQWILGRQAISHSRRGERGRARV